MVILSKQLKVPVLPAIVDITGSGNVSYCYTKINGTQYVAAASGIKAKPGEKITFGICGSTKATGYVKVNGTNVYTTTTSSLSTYDWVIPSGTKAISISMSYASRSPISGNITVTTT